MDVQQENQPEREADARLTHPSFVTISFSSSRSQIVKASRTTADLRTGLVTATAGNTTRPSSLLHQTPFQLPQYVAPGIQTEELGRAHLFLQQGMTRHPTRACAHVTELS